MHKRYLLLVLPASALLQFAAAVANEPALAQDGPANLSCISDDPLPDQRVRRDCAKDDPEEPILIEEPYQPPLPIDVHGDHGKGERGGMSGGADHADGPDHAAGSDHAAGAN